MHLTESCDEDLPHLITHVAAAAGPAADGEQTPVIHRALEQKGLLPGTHLVDTGYLDADLLVECRENFGVDLFGPPGGSAMAGAARHAPSTGTDEPLPGKPHATRKDRSPEDRSAGLL